MDLSNVSLDSITIELVESLLASELGSNKESLTIDFKAETELNSDSQKHKFRKLVCSFANTAGGDILIGISQLGTNYSFVGIPESTDTDKLFLQISNIVNSGLQPKLTRPIALHEVSSDGKKLLIIRVYQSFNKPHAVIVEDGFKFYIRLPHGQSVAMDWFQIRSAFLLSETYLDQMKGFKTERIGNILAGNLPNQLPSEGKLVIQVIPVEALNKDLQIDPQIVHPGNGFNTSLLAPIRATGINWQYNFEGLLSYSSRDRVYLGPAHSYTQFFRNGTIEFLYTIAREREGRWQIPSTGCEDIIANAIARALNVYSELSLSPPVYIAISFINVKGCSLAVNSSFMFSDDEISLNQDVLFLPELRFDSFDSAQVYETLRMTFHQFWQCFGYERSFNYDEKGKRITHP